MDSLFKVELQKQLRVMVSLNHILTELNNILSSKTGI